jgi:transcriptional regulator with XRE-family HTH domain
MRERRQLGQWIASARKARGWRTVDLAAAAGCAERTVRQLEAARDLPTLAVLRRVAYTLGIGFRCGLLVGAALRAAPYGYQTDAARNRRRREISQRAAECRAGRQGAGPR